MRLDVVQPGTGSIAPRVIYVIDDDGDLRRSLHFLLETKSICVSPYAGGIQFLSDVATLRPAPIILDIRMPRMDGTAVLSELSKRQIKWPVIVLTGHGEVDIAVQSLKSGATDFLEKPVSADILFKAIDAAFDRLTDQSATDHCREKAAACIASLTPREGEVLRHLCEGHSTKQVAFDLSISPRTVEMHRANALRQLKVRTLIEAAALRRDAVPVA